MSNTEQEVTRPPTNSGNDVPDQSKRFFGYIASEKVREAIGRLLPKTPNTTEEERVDRFTAVLWTCIRDTPTLLECTFESLVGSALEAARLGLEPGKAEGLCYLIPRRISGTLVANFEVGYHGAVRLLYQSELISVVDAAVVYQKDRFEFSKGLNPILVHVPNWDERGERRGAWALIKLTTGESLFEFMPAAEIESIRNAVQGTDSSYSPWSKHWAEMAKKTVLKRVAKYAPRSTSARQAIALDDQSQEGIHDAAELLKVPTDLQDALGDPVPEAPALGNEERVELPKEEEVSSEASLLGAEPAAPSFPGPPSAPDFPDSKDFR